MSRNWGVLGVLLVGGCEVSAAGLAPGIEIGDGPDAGPRRDEAPPAMVDAADGRPSPGPASPRRDAGAADAAPTGGTSGGAAAEPPRESNVAPPAGDAAVPAPVGVPVAVPPLASDPAAGGPAPVPPAAPPPAPVAPATPPPPAASAAPPPAPVAPAAVIIRAKDIEVRTLRARRVVAKEIEVKSASVLRLIQQRGDKTWERERGDRDLKGAELVADTVYAREIEADHLEADEVVVERFELED